MNLLLLSNSSSDAGFLTHALDDIRTCVSGVSPGESALFIPFAGVTRDWDDYTALVAGAFEPLGVKVDSVHRAANAVDAVKNAKIIIVGGGNTFNLLHHVRHLGLLGAIRDAVRRGAAYIGWSAGSNLACPTIRTTNDMPIVDSHGLDALALVPFQINAHYTDAHLPGHRGETRLQRLAEFCALNADTGVLGLPEGCGLTVLGSRYSLVGEHAAVWFQGAREPVTLRAGMIDLPLASGAEHDNANVI